MKKKKNLVIKNFLLAWPGVPEKGVIGELGALEYGETSSDPMKT